MVEVERCPTGIPGLDELVEGGLPRGRVILLAGSCGTGKSIFGGQFLYNGVLRHKEPGILVSFEQNVDLLRTDMLNIGFDFKKLEGEKKLVIISTSSSKMAALGLGKEGEVFNDFVLPATDFNIDKVIGLIEKVAKEIKAKRVVVDSFSALDNIVDLTGKETSGDKTKQIRKAMFDITYKLQNMGLTSILISDVTDSKISKHGIEEYMVDGVITLHYSTFGPNAGRYLTINKMRSTKHSEEIHTVRFKRGVGVEVLGSGEVE